jgi:hypothetical protein
MRETGTKEGKITDKHGERCVERAAWIKKIRPAGVKVGWMEGAGVGLYSGHNSV